MHGYHYYCNYWQPQPEQKLVYFREKNNPYNFFAIKVTVAEPGMVVGHLPMENLSVTKNIFDRGARVYAILTSTNYCISSLVQGGLEILCRIEIHMPATVKNKELMKIHKTYVDTLTLSITSKRRPTLPGHLLMGAANLRKMVNTVVKKTIKTT